MNDRYGSRFLIQADKTQNVEIPLINVIVIMVISKQIYWYEQRKVSNHT